MSVVIIMYTEGNVQKVSSIHLLVGCFFKSVLEFLLKKGFDILSNLFDILIKINYIFIPFYPTLLTNLHQHLNRVPLRGPTMHGPTLYLYAVNIIYLVDNFITMYAVIFYLHFNTQTNSRLKY